MAGGTKTPGWSLPGNPQPFHCSELLFFPVNLGKLLIPMLRICLVNGFICCAPLKL